MASITRSSNAVQILFGGILLAELATMADALSLLRSLSLSHSLEVVS